MVTQPIQFVFLKFYLISAHCTDIFLTQLFVPVWLEKVTLLLVHKVR